MLTPFWRLAALAALAARARAPPPSSDAGWSTIKAYSAAPKALESLPPGCTCLSADCAQFDCGCVCDLTVGQCDANCCCDAECSPDEVTRFESLGACLPAGPQNLSVASCLSVELSQSLVFVNPRSRMSVRSSSSVLCVAVDNSPILGAFLADPGLLQPSTLDQASVARATTFKQATSKPTSGFTNASAFDIGALVPSSAAGGYWPLPAVGLAAGDACGLSGAGTFVKYRVDVMPPRQCFVSLLLTPSSCPSLSPSSFLSALVAPFPASDANVPIAINSVSSIDPATGLLTAQPPVSPAATTFAEGAANCSCSNALVGLAYSVTYSVANMMIISVTADVTVATVYQDAGLCGVEPVAVPITSSVVFLPDVKPAVYAAGDAYALGDVQGRSGEPGYVMGAPVLAGVLVNKLGPLGTATPAASDQLAIARSAPYTLLSRFENLVAGFGFQLAGLSLRGPAADGSCVAAPALGAGIGADRARTVPIHFGEDVAASCALQLNASQLQTLCSPTFTPPLTVAYVGLGSARAGGVPTTFTHVGVLGNSDPWKTWQWLPLSTDTPPLPSWSSTTYQHQCSGLVTGVNLELLVAHIGAANNPQSEIIAARVKYTTGTWTFAHGDGTQVFLMESTVTFTNYDTAATTVWKPAPPVIPPMPSDLWYPFLTAEDGSLYISSGSARGVAGPALVALVAVAAAVAALVNR